MSQNFHQLMPPNCQDFLVKHRKNLCQCRLCRYYQYQYLLGILMMIETDKWRKGSCWWSVDWRCGEIMMAGMLEKDASCRGPLDGLAGFELLATNNRPVQCHTISTSFSHPLIPTLAGWAVEWAPSVTNSTYYRLIALFKSLQHL